MSAGHYQCSNLQGGKTMTAQARIIELNAQSIPHNPGRGNRMNPDIIDQIDEVTDKLTAVTDFFNFYQSGGDMINFRKNSINGICRIIDDCIDKLEALKK
jgi:hypothetical protein